MREQEAKLFLGTSRNVEGVANKLRRAGISLGDPKRQVDRVYAFSIDDMVNPRPGTVIARVREQDESDPLVTVKRRRDRDLDREECEFAVSDGSVARRALVLLGLTELVIVRKQRRSGRLTANISLEVDEVEGLGLFVELEMMTNDDTTSEDTATDDRLQLAILQVAEFLGDVDRSVNKGYDRLLVEAGLAGSEGD